MDATFLDSMVSLFLNGLLIRPEQRADAPSAFPIGPAPGLTPSASASTNPQGETP
jgi:hypothetical protein